MNKTTTLLMMSFLLVSCASGEKVAPDQTAPASSGAVITQPVAAIQENKNVSKPVAEVPAQEVQKTTVQNVNTAPKVVSMSYADVKKKYTAILQLSTGNTVWNQVSGKLGYVKQYKKGADLVGEVHVLIASSGQDTVVEKFTLGTSGGKEFEKMNITLKEFSPSGVYLWYEKSGFEACEGVMQDTSTKEKMPWDLFGCPMIHWSMDAKQVVLGFGNGMYGEGKILKSVRGNIRTLETVVKNPNFASKISGYFDEQSSLNVYEEKGEGRVAFMLDNEEGGQEYYVVDLATGMDVKRR